MYNKIVGYNVDAESEKEIECISSFYNCRFINHNNLLDVEREINNISEQINYAIAIDVDKIDDDGNQIFKFVAKHKGDSIFFISSLIDPEDRVRWLSYGIDGYLVKPFHPAELLIRSQKKTNRRPYTFEDTNFTINYKSREITYLDNVLTVAPKIFDVIVYFVDHPNKIITRQEIMIEALGYDYYLSDKYVNNVIAKIRDFTSKELIKTIHGVGYVYVL